MPKSGGAGAQNEERRRLEQQLEDYIIASQADLYRLAMSYMRQPDAAMDVVQEAAVKALANKDRLKEDCHLKAWVYRIVVNESISYLRRNKRRLAEASALDGLTSEETDIPQAIDLYRAVERLDPKLRGIVVLRYFEDLKLEEVSAVTGLKLSTVKARLYKALRLLKNEMGEEA